nr:hypothetical protein [Oceanobacillus zhaokaii]
MNNAGVEGQVGPLTSADPKQVDFTLDVNIKGTIYGIQADGNQMKKQGNGGVKSLTLVLLQDNKVLKCWAFILQPNLQ